MKMEQFQIITNSLFHRDLLIFSYRMYLWLVHIICSNWREEVGSNIFRTNIVGVGIWMIHSPYVVLCSKDTIFSWFNMSPSIPISIFTRCIGRTRALCIKFGVNWSPSTWNIILQSEIIFGSVGSIRCYRDTYSIELSLMEYSIGIHCCWDELSIWVNSFWLINLLKYSSYS